MTNSSPRSFLDLADTMTEENSKLSPLVKLGLDLGPLVIFFVLLMRYDIFAATISYVVLAPIVVGTYWFYERKVPPMVLVSSVIILLFGGLTIYLHDDTFIKMKPTIVYAIFSTVLIGGLVIDKLFIKMLMESSMKMEDQGWRIMTYGVVGLFICLAIANEVVWRNFSDGFWAGFKIAVIPITLVAFAAITLSCSKYMIADESSEQS